MHESLFVNSSFDFNLFVYLAPIMILAIGK